MPNHPSDRSTASRRSILESARREIEETGILGLRVAVVAAQAHCSITQIYRYFESRDGLLAAVLGDMYEEYLDESTKAYQAKVLTRTNLTVDDIVDALPSVFEPAVRHRQEMRLQILAASVNNEKLRERLAEATHKSAVAWEQGLDELDTRLAPGQKIDRRVFTMMLATSLPYYRILMGDTGFSHAEYLQFMKDKLSG